MTYTALLLLVLQACVNAAPMPRSEVLEMHMDDGECDVQPGSRVDCGHVGTDQPACEASGCCWFPASDDHPQRLTDVPWCFFKKGAAPSCPLNHSFAPAPPFDDDEVATMRSYFLANINVDGSGAVVAAPDHNTPGGSYFYHWERDGALSMGALLRTAANLSDVREQMDAYTGWVAKVQQEADPHDQSVLAEPKYYIPNGTVYDGPWCRPQNDGPGLRAKTIIEYAEALSASGVAADEQGAADLWSLIKTDLDWAAANWQADGCDLWEEIRSNDFFWNRFTARAALTKGAAFATKQGDSSRAETYSSAAAAVGATLESHYDSGFIFETQSRKKDSAVICALNDGYLGDGVFAPSSKEVAGTISTLNGLFCDSFTINQVDTKAGIPGILYGRYEGDNYAGGNPWILLTSALAELLYRAAADMHSKGDAHVLDTETFIAWSKALSLPAQTTPEDGASAVSLASAMAGAADGVLKRLRSHVATGSFHLPEQIDRSSGVPMAAHDLTWSYATTLKAMHARGQYTKLL